MYKFKLKIAFLKAGLLFPLSSFSSVRSINRTETSLRVAKCCFFLYVPFSTAEALL